MSPRSRNLIKPKDRQLPSQKAALIKVAMSDSDLIYVKGFKVGYFVSAGRQQLTHFPWRVFAIMAISTWLFRIHRVAIGIAAAEDFHNRLN